MTIESLQERISKAEERISKKEATIQKKQGWIEKAKAFIKQEYNVDPDTFNKYLWRELPLGEEKGYALYWKMCDIDNWEQDIKNTKKNIVEIRKTIDKYNAQLNGEIERESILIKEVPESMKRMQVELVNEWDKYDIKRREKIREDSSKMEYKEWTEKYNHYEREMIYLSDEQIHKSNMRDAKMFIINLYNRVKDITGEVTDWDGIRLDEGTHWFPILVGKVVGKMGTAYVNSILAGGWNIQRLHVRVLVTEA